jgi:quercetin dioxygenase-like cupin family protein
MSDNQPPETSDAVRSVHNVAQVALEWGNLVWLVGSDDMPGAQQTFGVVTVHPGKRNPLHRHPNCEELLYVLEGEADHLLGDEMYRLKAGDVIRIPQGVPHWARATSDSPVVAIISFSSGDRQTENLDSGDDIA